MKKKKNNLFMCSHIRDSWMCPCGSTSEITTGATRRETVRNEFLIHREIAHENVSHFTSIHRALLTCVRDAAYVLFHVWVIHDTSRATPTSPSNRVGNRKHSILLHTNTHTHTLAWINVFYQEKTQVFWGYLDSIGVMLRFIHIYDANIVYRRNRDVAHTRFIRIYRRVLTGRE